MEISKKIRDIEKIIDSYHKDHEFLIGTKEQILYEVLVTFGDMCTCSFFALVLNPFSIGKIRDYMDALNQAINWIEQSDIPSSDEDVEYNISEDRYLQCKSFLLDYAYPYSVICSGYISYSRNRLKATLNDNTITFDISDNNKSTWSDILREKSEEKLLELHGISELDDITSASAKLVNNCYVEDGQLCYTISHDILQPFLKVAFNQWEVNKSLPNDWEFDLFSLEEYKQTWIDLTALCYMHLFCLMSTKDATIRINNSVIRHSVDDMINYLNSINGLDESTLRRIVDFISYDSTIKNNDIMYQPLIIIDKKTLLIAPILFLGSNPERNLLSLINLKNNDEKHSSEVNKLEELMVKEIEELLPNNDKVIVIKHKFLKEDLPDIDLGIMDINSNSVLLCELKWFTAADSTKEVYAREDDITHGCAQQDQIMGFALQDREKFIKKTFGLDNCGNTDIYCCVVARNNIRTKNKYVPVIDLDTIKKLLKNKSLIDVFRTIRNHEYEIPMPQDAKIDYQSIAYAGYTFKIPAIVIGSENN